MGVCTKTLISALCVSSSVNRGSNDAPALNPFLQKPGTMALRSCGTTASASHEFAAKVLAIQGRRFLTTGAKHTPASRDLNATEEAKAAVVIGEKFQMERSFTSEDVASYVQLCGDTNPIHTSESAAQIAGFQGRVVQGMLYAGLFPAIIGSQFERAVYVSQTLNFRAPVLVGEPLCAEVEVTAVKKLRHHYRVTFATQCYKKGDSNILLGGEAVALLPSQILVDPLP